MFITIWQEGERRVLEMTADDPLESMRLQKPTKSIPVAVKRGMPLNEFKLVLQAMEDAMRKELGK